MTSTIDISTKEIWTAEETAAYTGYSVKHILDLCNSGVLPHYKPAGRIFLEKADVLAWIRGGKKESADDLGIKAYRHESKRKAS